MNDVKDISENKKNDLYGLDTSDIPQRPFSGEDEQLPEYAVRFGRFVTSPATVEAAPVRMVAGKNASKNFDGDLWNEKIQQTLNIYLGRMVQRIETCIFTATANKVVANTVTETSLKGTGIGSLSLPQNFFAIGKTIRLKAYGFFSDTGTPTLDIKLKLGSSTICSTTATALVGTITNDGWSIETVITCRTIGATGTVIGQGMFEYKSADGTHLVSTATTTIDTTAIQVLDLTATWGAADPADTMTCTNLVVEVIN